MYSLFASFYNDFNHNLLGTLLDAVTGVRYSLWIEAKLLYYIMLTGLLLIPLLGALILAPMNETTPSDISRVKRVALLTTVVTFILSMIM